MYFMSDAPVGCYRPTPPACSCGGVLHLLVCLGIYQITIYLVFLYVSLYLIMYFQQFKWFLINLLLTTCILRYSLLLDVLIDICFVFTIYLINLADINRRYSGYCF